MRGKRSLVTAATVLLALLLAGATLAAAVPAPTSEPFVIAGGGGHAEASSLTLDGTIGQAVVGVAPGRLYELCSGYWCNVGGEWRLHLPLVLRSA